MRDEGSTRRLRGEEPDQLWALFAAMSAIADVREHGMVERIRGIPNGFRDLRMIEVRLRSLLEDILRTVPSDKVAHMRQQMAFVEYQVVPNRPAVARNPELALISEQDLTLALLAAHEHCRLCAYPDRCRQCDIGRLLDRQCKVDRGDRSWFTVDPTQTSLEMPGTPPEPTRQAEGGASGRKHARKQRRRKDHDLGDGEQCTEKCTLSQKSDVAGYGPKTGNDGADHVTD